MKERISHETVKRKLVTFLLFSFKSLLLLSTIVIDPTTVLAQSNCACATCGRKCEEIKTLGHKPGYSCYQGVPNQGSTNTPGQVKPESASGKSHNPRHPSSDIEDYARDLEQMLNSLLLDTLNISKIPLTGDNEFNKFYINQVTSFNNPEQGGDVDFGDSSVFSGKTIRLLTTEQQQKKRDDWMNENGLNNLTPINSDGITNLTSAQLYDIDVMLRNLGIDLIKLGLVGLAVPTGGVASTLFATVVIAIGFEEVKALYDCLYEEKCLPKEEIIYNGLKTAADDVLALGLGKVVGKIAENSKFVEDIIIKDKVAKGVSPGFAWLSTQESKIGGKITDNVEKVFGFGNEIGNVGLTISKIREKWLEEGR